LAYSQGFHPQPRLNLACALPLGFTSQCEIIDAWLEEALPLPQVRDALASTIPPGLEITRLESVEASAPALQTQVTSTVYIITFLDDIPDLEERISTVISANNLPRERRGKPYDLRPLIEGISKLPQDINGKTRIQLQLSAREGATGRPEEFLAAMGIKYETTRVHREVLMFHS
jgi:radical SAM-linked protein